MRDDAETQTNGRDPKSGRFLAGNSGNGGRKPGSRNKLSEQFLSDLLDEWAENGKTALSRMCANHPEQFCKLVGSLLPSKIDTTLHLDAELFQRAHDFRQAYKIARDYLADRPLIELNPAEASHDGE